MNDKKDENGNFLQDSERLTSIGAFVRKTSLDEIPQLINVIKGDMSLIGPRPLLVNYLHLYSDFQKQRHNVKPGITGWAQINGRNAITWDKKFELDVYYVKNISFFIDLKILFLTFLKVFQAKGISAENNVTIEPFAGKNEVFLIGAGGHCKVVIDLIQSQNQLSVISIYDDIIENKNLYQIPIFQLNSQTNFSNKTCVISIGDNKVREKIVNRLQTNYAMVIHKTAIVSKFAIIEKGTQVMAGAIINPNAIIGKHCIINTGSVIEHDCVLEDFVHICPNATLGGGVKIGKSSFIGIGSTVIQGIKIGKNVIVGAGSVIIKNIPDHAVVVGAPGKIIKYSEK